MITLLGPEGTPSFHNPGLMLSGRVLACHDLVTQVASLLYLYTTGNNRGGGLVGTKPTRTRRGCNTIAIVEDTKVYTLHPGSRFDNVISFRSH